MTPMVKIRAAIIKTITAAMDADHTIAIIHATRDHKDQQKADNYNSPILFGDGSSTIIIGVVVGMPVLSIPASRKKCLHVVTHFSARTFTGSSVYT